MTSQAHADHDSPAPSASEMARRSSGRRDAAAIEIGLDAAVVAVMEDEPVVLVVGADCEKQAIEGLPTGPFSPQRHRTLEGGLRSWVETQTGIAIGYAEQLCTFGDRGRHEPDDETDAHVMSIGYLALARASATEPPQRGAWRGWYDFFPWEDWRRGRPEILMREIEPRLRDWAARQPAEDDAHPLKRSERVRICFGVGGPWDEEKVLDRYELLYEAGLAEEARRDGLEAAREWSTAPRLGEAMRGDHRRVLATAIGRVRGKLKYRPVVFELMADDFTLFELQKTVEAILGPHLHKQNFRRLVESAGLVEPTGEVRARTGGRPAKLFRFRREVLIERPSPGVRVRSGRA